MQHFPYDLATFTAGSGQEINLENCALSGITSLTTIPLATNQNSLASCCNPESLSTLSPR
jgi:hypothetical protein